MHQAKTSTIPKITVCVHALSIRETNKTPTSAQLPIPEQHFLGS
uniref:Uncharacterized protein n=1 Tax=Human betaherpesvirus 6 TaxID=10368 RepID=A0A1W6GBH0_9BETA|nr:hypothetical protein [Human betaherpesvirus 6]ARM06991.1 hypothetical protein [Human betaherpesvirus 6]ARM07982.1 hypothetical protein [Human betaherpesvirus 6]ARM08587.1 hypothetical protein [Human betaherpesvirus 6]ARM09076.1 hypothetical protein [Human betaherpesvirus 6]